MSASKPMHFFLNKHSIPFTFLGALAAAIGCSSEPDDDDGSTPDELSYCVPATTCPPDVEGVDLTTAVSFAADVMPIFQQRCNDSLCHGSPSRSQAGLYLGPEAGDPAPTTEESGEIIAYLTAAESKVASGASLVVASDWTTSFLMAKVDGCQNEGGFTCSGDESPLQFSLCETDCGDGMPQVDVTEEGIPYPLEDSDRTTIRRWIQQGAQNN